MVTKVSIFSNKVFIRLKCLFIREFRLAFSNKTSTFCSELRIQISPPLPRKNLGNTRRLSGIYRSSLTEPSPRSQISPQIFQRKKSRHTLVGYTPGGNTPISIFIASYNFWSAKTHLRIMGSLRRA